MTIRCPYCHEYIDDAEFREHEVAHLGRREDGQLSAYRTLPPEEQWSGSLEGVPRAYRHGKCGVATEMSEDLIRTYLADPFFYSNRTFCCGCGSHVRHRELTWVETGENVADYFRRLRAAVPLFDARRWRVVGNYLVVAAVGAVILGLLGLGAGALVGHWLLGLLTGAGVGALTLVSLFAWGRG